MNIHLESNSCLPDYQYEKILKPKFKGQLNTKKIIKKSNINDLSLYDLKEYLSGDILFKLDRVSMLNSIEMRSPFLSSSLIDFAQKFPKYHKNVDSKNILKKILNQNLVDGYKNREKNGFGAPLESWFMNKSFYEFAITTVLSNKAYIINNFLEKRELKRIIDKNPQFLWNIFIFELWYMKYV